MSCDVQSMGRHSPGPLLHPSPAQAACLVTVNAIAGMQSVLLFRCGVRLVKPSHSVSAEVGTGGPVLRPLVSCPLTRGPRQHHADRNSQIIHSAVSRCREAACCCQDERGCHRHASMIRPLRCTEYRARDRITTRDPNNSFGQDVAWLSSSHSTVPEAPEHSNTGEHRPAALDSVEHLATSGQTDTQRMYV